MQQPKLKVSFLIDATELGAFVHQYADKVQALDIGAIEGVAWNKNKPRDGAVKGFGLSRDQAISVAKKMRADILKALKKGPLSSGQIYAKFKDVPKQPIWQLLNRMRHDHQIVRNEANAFKLPTQAPRKTQPRPKRPRGGYNFEKPEIRAKATKKASDARAVPKNFKLGNEKPSMAGRKATEIARKRGFDFAAAGRKGNEAKRLKKLQQQKLNGNGNPSVPTTEGN